MDPVASRSYSFATESSLVFVMICVSFETAHMEFRASPDKQGDKRRGTKEVIAGGGEGVRYTSKSVTHDSAQIFK